MSQQSLVTLIVGALASFIAFLQYKTAIANYREKILDRRLKVYDALRKLFAFVELFEYAPIYVHPEMVVRKEVALESSDYPEDDKEVAEYEQSELETTRIESGMARREARFIFGSSINEYLDEVEIYAKLLNYQETLIHLDHLSKGLKTEDLEAGRARALVWFSVQQDKMHVVFANAMAIQEPAESLRSIGRKVFNAPVGFIRKRISSLPAQASQTKSDDLS